jgi:Tol biopolymer transport system component
VWAPDGRSYAYVSNANGIPELWFRSTGESVSRRLASGDLETGVERAAFSPDGQRLAFVRIGLKHVIWVSHVSGGPAVPLENQTADQHSPAWSPSGDWICFTDATGVYAVPAVGGERRLLRNSGEAWIGFARDGANLSVLERRREDGRRAWWLLTLRVPDGTEVSKVRMPFAPDFDVRGFSLNPDGRRFAVAGVVMKRDIWMREGELE